MSTYTKASLPKQVDWGMLASHGWVVDNNDCFMLAIYPNTEGSVSVAIEAIDDNGMRVFGMDWPQVQMLAETLKSAMAFAEQIQEENRKSNAAEMTVELVQRIKQGVRNGSCN